MSKGTSSMGKKSRRKTHITCRRCGNHTYHARHRECAKCNYGKTARLRAYSWQKK